MNRSSPARRDVAPIRIDQPEPGCWKLRLYKDGWTEVPVRINHFGGLWSAEIDGEICGIPNADPFLADGVSGIWERRKTPISEAEYTFLNGRLKAWAREFYPDHPLLDPRKKVTPASLRPIPQFNAPKTPEALAPEPMQENRPAPPRPLDPAAVTAWLNYQEEALVRDIKADITQLVHDADGVLSVGGERVRDLGANLDTAKAHLKLAEKHRVEAKAPFLKGGNAVDHWFGRATLALKTAIEPVQRLLDDYAKREDARRRQEAQEAARKAQEAADLLARQAAAAMRQNPSAATVEPLLADAGDAAKEAERAAALATGSSADLVRETTSYGRLMSSQESFDFGITDITQVPLQYMQVNEVLVRAAIKAYARDDVVAAREDAEHHRSPIPGIKVLRNIAMRNR